MLNASEQSGVVTTGPWATRDGFVADTAVKFDRLQAKIDRLEHQNEVIRQRVAELIDNAQQVNRLHAFQESLRNSREYKIDEVLRCAKDAKARLDQIEGDRARFKGLTYRSFEAIDGKLTELGDVQKRLRAVERKLMIAAALFCGSLLLLAGAIATRLA